MKLKQKPQAKPEIVVVHGEKQSFLFIQGIELTRNNVSRSFEFEHGDLNKSKIL